MIPKIIHYCWFGGNNKSTLIKKCIRSWKKYCPDYKIIEWNESNFDINCCDYVREAYEAKKWAFVTDYARLKILYENGGIYFDTDVELISSIDEYLQYDGFFCFEDNKHIATGLGFGVSIANHFVKAMIDDYNGVRFIKNDGTFDLLPCPQRNTMAIEKMGLIRNGNTQIINNNIFLSAEYFNPINCITGEKVITKNTHAIHWFNASWWTQEQKRYNKIKKRKQFIEKKFGNFGIRIYTILLSIQEIGIKQLVIKLINKIRHMR